MFVAQNFEGKVILITGGASGMGRATALYLAARGASLSLADLSSDGLDETVRLSNEAGHGAQILTRVVDVTKPEDVEGWVLASKEKFGKINGCLNAAGLASPHYSIVDASFEDFDRIMSVNVRGVFTCLKYQLSHIENGSGIVNIASVLGLYGVPNYAPYVASKYGVVGLTKTAAVEVADRGIRVNAVCPSWVDTPMKAGHAKDLASRGMGALTEEQYTAPQLFHRVAQPEEVAGLIAYLLSDESRFITKVAYEISGGFAG